MGRTGHYANRPSAEMTDITIERTYPTSPERVWELWTTPAGIEQWWAPDRFEAKVAKLELEPGGELDHSPTATAPEQMRVVKQAQSRNELRHLPPISRVVVGEARQQERLIHAEIDLEENDTDREDHDRAPEPDQENGTEQHSDVRHCFRPVSPALRRSELARTT